MLKKIFGSNNSKKSNKKVTSPSKKHSHPTLPETIIQIQEVEDSILKKQAYLEQKIKEEVKFALKNKTTNKKLALKALARKKRHEDQLKTLSGTLANLEDQKNLLDNANINKTFVDTMAQTSQALKSAHKNMDSDKVGKLLDDLAEHKEQIDDISSVIAGPVGFEDYFDEDELAKELDALELEALEHDPDLIAKMPSVPVKKREPKKQNKIALEA